LRVCTIKRTSGLTNIHAGISKSELEPMMELATPVLLKVGMLDLFPVDEWIASKSQGRQFMGKKLKELGH
jgi:hypothetical protein